MKNYKYFLLLMTLVAGIGAANLAATFGVAAATNGNLPKKCRVILAGGTEATVVSTKKNVFLKAGTRLTLISSDMHQGYIAVKAMVAGRLTTLSINVEDTDCMD